MEAVKAVFLEGAFHEGFCLISKNPSKKITIFNFIKKFKNETNFKDIT